MKCCQIADFIAMKLMKTVSNASQVMQIVSVFAMAQCTRVVENALGCTCLPVQ